MRHSLLEPHCPAVGLHDLPYQLETQAVLPTLGTGDICLPIQRLQPGGIHPNAIISHCAGASASLRPYHNGDTVALGIVDNTVADQIVQHPPQESGVALHSGSTVQMCLGKLQLILLWDSAVEMCIRDRP